jgi:hypothetical protein
MKEEKKEKKEKTRYISLALPIKPATLAVCV